MPWLKCLQVMHNLPLRRGITLRMLLKKITFSTNVRILDTLLAVVSFGKLVNNALAAHLGVVVVL